MDSSERNRDVVDPISIEESQQLPEASFLPALFRHDDLVKAVSSAKSIEKKKIINILNYLHFEGTPVRLLLTDARYAEDTLVTVRHEPCLGDELACRWGASHNGSLLSRKSIQYLVISHEQSVILVPVNLLEAKDGGLTLRLKEAGLVISERKMPRYRCREIKAELCQQGFQAVGDLVDISGKAFRIHVSAIPPASFSWLNFEAPATLRLCDGKNLFYTGECTIMYEQQKDRGRDIVLSPVNEKGMQRFKAKVHRNPRMRISAPFYASFEHPLTKKKVQRGIFDISSSGFSLRDSGGEAVLVPGLIIPKLTIAWAGVLKIICRAQVVYRKEDEEGVRFGFAILDIDLSGYRNLSRVINALSVEDNSTTNEVDPEALWEFFFDSDFIYPQKYKNLHEKKEDFKAVYKKLYEESPEIANHFVYQRDGRIYGHIAMLRVFEKAWMAHHHAARPLDGRPVGLHVLKQLVMYLNDVHRIPSANLDYVMAYYRPENEFPNRIFGGFAREAADAQHCSIDDFAYISFPAGSTMGKLPPDWYLRECEGIDYCKFEQFYRNHSGGLLWPILKPDGEKGNPSLEETYSRSGFTRRWKSYVLNHQGNSQAFIIAEESDMGINLSNLLNGFKVFVADPALPPDILFTALDSITRKAPSSYLSLLIHPLNYAEKLPTKYERKQYVLWILNMRHSNEYVDYLRRKFRIRLS
ncbi:MAG: PilZ domain-containing protein [Syntrophales bacterium]|nr:PilZ domain-containing protein [Syntrophales bacterium]